MKAEHPKSKKQDQSGRGLPKIFTPLRRLFFEDVSSISTPKAARQAKPRKRVALPSFLARSLRWFRGLHPALRWGAGGGSFLSAVAWLLIASLVTSGAVSGLTPETARAAGVYTSSSTDTLGNTHLAANSVTASSTYNLDEDDSSEDIQQQLGVDPNWRNGVVRGSGALRYSSAATSRISSLNAQFTPTMTMEGWFNIPSTVPVYGRFFGSGSANGYGTGIDTSNNLSVSVVINGSGTYISCSPMTGSNSLASYIGSGWFHFAFIFEGNGSTTTSRWYVNGVQLGSCTYAYSLPASNIAPNGIGSLPNSGGQSLQGLIDEVRYSNIARYTSNFTPQRRFTEDANTTALYHFDETGQTIFDSSGNGYHGTLGSNSSVESSDPTRVDGAQAINQGFRGCSPDDTNAASCSTGGRMGAGNLTLGSNSSTTDDKQYEVQMAPSGAAQTTGQTASVANNSSQVIGTSDFTIEAWFKTAGTARAGILSKSNSAISGTWDLRVQPTGNCGGIFPTIGTCGTGSGVVFSEFGGGVVLADNLSVRDGAWHHIAVTRSGTTYSLFIDGILRQSGTSAQRNLNSTDNLCLHAHTGCVYGGDNAMLDEVRLSNIARYTSDFIPARRHKADANTMALYHLDEATGTTAYDASGNGNTMTFTATPTWTTGITRTNPLEGDPLYYQYRDVGNATWSTALPSPTTSTQLGTTGIFLRFNPAGQYSAYDRFLVHSWAVEAPSTSSPQRGTRRSFPARAHLTATSAGLDIIDSATNTLWMRLPTGSTMLGTSGLQAVSAENGRIYLASTGSGNLTSIRLESDGFTTYSTSGNAVGARVIAARTGTSSYGTASGLALTANAPTAVSVNVLGTNPPRQYVAVASGTSGRVVVLAGETAALSSPITSTEGTAYSYDRAVSASTYTKVLLTSNGTLYAGNSSAGGVDVWTNIQSDTANQTTADRTYTTTSTPALRSNTVNSLSATTATSSAQTGSNTLAIGHNLGVDTIDEHSTQASSGIRYYTREGSTGTSGYNQKQFGGGIFTKLIGTNSVVRASMSSYSNSNMTIEMLYNPTTISPSSSPHRFLYSGGGNCSGNNIELYLSGGSIPTLCTQSILSQSTSALPTANVWYHLVFQISAGVPSIYVNGIRQTLVSTPTYTSGTVSATANAYIGARTSEANANCSQCTIAYYDEFRISNTARYTSNFTPSKVPFTSDANTVALYHFNERDGQTIYDSSANANNGTLGATSSVSTDDPLRVIPAISGASDKVTAVGLTKSGGTARGMRFDGSNDNIVVPANDNLASNTVTVGFWVRGDSQNNFPRLFSHSGNSTSSPGFEITGRSGNSNSMTIRIDTSGGVNQLVANGTCTLIPFTGQWNHVVFTISGSTAIGYLNGAQGFSCPFILGAGIANAGVTTKVGGVSGAYLNGSISSVRYYNTALSATDVANLYSAERMGRTFDGYSGNLVGHWKLDERSGQTIIDSSGTSNNGTFGATSSVATDDPTPTIEGPALVQSPTLWVATNGAGSNDGAVTSIGGPNDRQDKIFTTTNSDLPDLDVSTLSMSGGGLAFIGTEAGGWSTGTGGAPELTNGERKGALNIRGATRITGRARVSR